MQIYLVGGAVRDKLLGREITERDYVVVGATPEEMLALGYRPVGKDFPVFLHPDTAEEYALARTERKTGKGYTGFDCFADPSVTLEQDLLRRDLTINAMAEDDAGNIIDPYHGQDDLRKKILRHVSDAFNEDPVRILRVARFAARFPEFSVHPETNARMISMVENGEINALVAERVWKELSRALTEIAPKRFFEVLAECNALPLLMPELSQQQACLEMLERSIAISNAGHIRFAALTSPLSAIELTQLCTRLRPPTLYSELSEMVVQQTQHYQTLDIHNAENVIAFLEQLDAYRRPERFADFCLVAGLTLPTHRAEQQRQSLSHALDLTFKIDTHAFIQQGLEGKAIGEAIRNARLTKLRK